MTNLISEAAYESALKAGRKALEQPHAVSARYNARSHELTLLFSNGLKCSFDVRKAAVLGEYPGADFSEPYVTPGGDGLVFDRAGLSVGVPALVAPFLPQAVARYSVASARGRRTSPEKAAAARLNGAKGGRPRGTARQYNSPRSGLDIVHVSSEKELWEHKRQKQARDIENVQAGRISASSMSWFTVKQARGAKIRNAPY